jgi:Pyruvate/2-oxoacid:ferredoxin oxidoreductase delta subunit
MSDADAHPIPNGGEQKHRVRLLAVVNPSCTGCEVCVDFCPVDCIDDVPSADPRGDTRSRIHIREPECIGCRLCAKVCEELDWNAIDMVPVEEFERRFGVDLNDHIVGEKSPREAPAPVS